METRAFEMRDLIVGQRRFRFLRFDFVRMRNRTRSQLLLELLRYRDSEHQLAAYFLETFLLAIVLKETPSRRRHVPRDL